ncbi:hypothetical protein RFI_24926, partial [Reticulomyxa filosa]
TFFFFFSSHFIHKTIQKNQLDPTLTIQGNEAQSSLAKSPGPTHPNNNNNNNNGNQTAAATTDTTKKSNDKQERSNEDKNEKTSEEKGHYQTLINELHQSLESEKEKVRNIDREYSKIQAQYQKTENELSLGRQREKEYLTRIQQLESQPKHDEKFKALIQERDSLKTTVESLKAKLNRPEPTPTPTPTKSDIDSASADQDQTIHQLKTKLSQIQQQKVQLTQERDTYRLRAQNANETIAQIEHKLKRAEESKLRLIQEATEQMNQLRHYLKLYNDVSAKQ